MASINLKDATVRIRDGSNPAKTVDIIIGEGNVSWTERKEREYILDRGNLDTVREGDDQPLELSLEARWEEYTSSVGAEIPPSPIEALKGNGRAKTLGWVSTDTDRCQPYAVDIIVEHVPRCDAKEIEQYLFSDFRYDDLEFDLDAGTISISGRCNVTEPTVTRHPHPSN